MFGLDILGLARYPEIAFKHFPAGFALGAFSRTFGDSLPAVEKIIATGKCPRVRIQLIWSDTHTFGDADIPTLIKESRRWQKLAQRFRNVTFELSPFCEHNLKNPDKYLDIVAREAKDCRPVNVPMRGALSTRYKNEVHGKHDKPKRGPYNFSFDGTNAMEVNAEAFKKKHAGADTFYLWHPSFNLKRHVTDKTPRDQRTVRPSREIFEMVLGTYTGATARSG